MRKSKVWLILNLMILTTSAHTVWALAGGDALREPIGVRQIGMGEAFAGFSGDLYSLHYNVAGLANLSTPTLGSMYAANIFETHSTFLILGVPAAWVSHGALSISLLNVVGAPIELNYLDGRSETILSQNDYIGTLGYAQQLFPHINAGIAIRAYQSTLLEKYTAKALSYDLGVLCKDLLVAGLHVGATIQNLGGEITYATVGDKMPTVMRAGVGYEASYFTQYQLRIGLDFLVSQDSALQQNIGLEYAWQDALFLRAGYKVGYDLDTFSIGSGIKWNGFQVDYSFSSFSIQENAHRLGITYNFGKPASVELLNGL